MVYRVPLCDKMHNRRTFQFNSQHIGSWLKSLVKFTFFSLRDIHNLQSSILLTPNLFIITFFLVLYRTQPFPWRSACKKRMDFVFVLFSFIIPKCTILSVVYKRKKISFFPNGKLKLWNILKFQNLKKGKESNIFTILDENLSWE